MTFTDMMTAVETQGACAVSLVDLPAARVLAEAKGLEVIETDHGTGRVTGGLLRRPPAPGPLVPRVR